MQHIKAVFLISLVFFSSLGITQEDIVDRLSQMSSDSALVLLDNEINLSRELDNEDQLFQLLKLKDWYTDSLDLDLKNHEALEELLSFRSKFSDEDFYDVLMREGVHLVRLGLIEKGINLHFDALRLADSLNQLELIAKTNKKISYDYQITQGFDVAKKYLFIALDQYESLQDTVGIAGCYMSLGNVYKNTDMLDSAIDCYNRSLWLSEKIDYKKGIAGNYNNIGNVHLKQDQYQTALDYFFDALKMNRDRGDKMWESYNLNNIGITYTELGNYENAIEFLLKSEQIKLELNDNFGLISTYENISEAYAGARDYLQAYDYLKKYFDLYQKLRGMEVARLSAEIEARMISEQKEAVIKQLQTEKELKELTIESQRRDIAQKEQIAKNERNFLYAMSGVAVLLIIALFFFWRNNRQRQAHNIELQDKNQEISKAKEQIEIKNQEIIDSINYAKRIQAAILPSDELVTHAFKNIFILYQPKDIVAGDFYWITKKDERIFFAVADCTGHGVPGAMVSVVCHNALNRSLLEFDLNTPNEILDKATELVIAHFDRSKDDLKDGMDIALCSYNPVTKVLHYSGANIPFWMVRNGEMVETRPDKQPVGRHAIRTPFTLHEIQLQEGDVIYLSSDGFPDQFGGEKWKKLKYAPFKNELLSIHQQEMPEQEKHLISFFENWKGKAEQIDDICVMGVRV